METTINGADYKRLTDNIKIVAKGTNPAGTTNRLRVQVKSSDDNLTVTCINGVMILRQIVKPVKAQEFEFWTGSLPDVTGATATFQYLKEESPAASLWTDGALFNILIDQTLVVSMGQYLDDPMREDKEPTKGTAISIDLLSRIARIKQPKIRFSDPAWKFYFDGPVKGIYFTNSSINPTIDGIIMPMKWNF